MEDGEPSNVWSKLENMLSSNIAKKYSFNRKCYSGCEEVSSLNNWNKSFLQKSSVAKQRELYKLFSSQVNNDVYSPVIKERDLDTYFVCNTRGFNISPGSAWIEYFCNYQVTKTGIFGFCCNWKLSPFVCLI